MIGRPQTTETAPYYFRYIDCVTGDSPLALLQEQQDNLLPFLSAIAERRSLHRYEPDKWSIRQVLNHVTDTERAFAFRALWFSRGFETSLPSYDQDIAALAANADSVSWAAHIEEFRAVRSSTISLFRNLPEAAWMRTGIASDNRFTVRALAFIIAGHLAHHVAIIRARYL